MSVENQKKRPDIDKLRKILDNPNDPSLARTLNAEDASLDSVRCRLTRTQTASARVRTPASLQPHITIRQPQPTAAATPAADELPLWTPVESTPITPKHIVPVFKAVTNFSDQDLFEVEFPEPLLPQFVPVGETATAQAQAMTEPVAYFEPVPQTPSPQTHTLPDWEVVTTQTSTGQPPTVPLQEFTDVTPQTSSASPQPSQPPPPPVTRQTWRQRRAVKKTARIQAREAKRREKLSRTRPAPQPTTITPAAEQPQRPSRTKTPLQPMPPGDAREAFHTIPSIDDRTADLLFRNGYYTVEQLRSTPVSTLVKIKGIRRKQAKQIKKDVDASFTTPKPPSAMPLRPAPKRQTKRKAQENEEEGTEWESYEAPGGPALCTYKGYTLYQRETRVDRKKTTLHFFSKTIPQDATPSSLPDGYTIDVNKRTGIPYLKKKK